MRRLLITVSLAAVLVAAPSAFAGGWATVGLSSTPAGVQPGDPWDVNITVLQHGRTPLEDVKPALTIRGADRPKTFAAKPTGKPVSTARVVLPERREVEVRGRRRVHQRAAAHVSRRCRSATPARGRAPRGPMTAARTSVLLAGVALLLAALALLVAPPRRATSRRRRESHHPRRRWPRLRGGGDDDRRLRRRRPGPAPTAGARSDAAAVRSRRRRSSPRRAAAPATGSRPPESAARHRPRSRAGAAGQGRRDYVMESIVAPDTVAATAGAGTMPEDFATRIPRRTSNRLVTYPA